MMDKIKGRWPNDHLISRNTLFCLFSTAQVEKIRSTSKEGAEPPLESNPYSANTTTQTLTSAQKHFRGEFTL